MFDKTNITTIKKCLEEKISKGMERKDYEGIELEHIQTIILCEIYEMIYDLMQNSNKN